MRQKFAALKKWNKILWGLLIVMLVVFVLGGQSDMRTMTGFTCLAITLCLIINITIIAYRLTGKPVVAIIICILSFFPLFLIAADYYYWEKVNKACDANSPSTFIQ